MLVTGGASYACAFCPGHDQHACCRFSEFQARRVMVLRGEAAADPRVAGARGRRRRWTLSDLHARLLRAERIIP
jgi:hypothetical protein